MDPRTVRYLAAIGAAASALLYFLIGIGTVSVGESTSGDTNILGFGLSAGAAFLVVAVLILLFARRWLWTLLLAFDLVVIVAYFVASSIRVPPFEVWGLAVKACQLVLGAALAYLVARGTSERRRVSTGRSS